MRRGEGEWGGGGCYRFLSSSNKPEPLNAVEEGSGCLAPLRAIESFSG